MYAVVVTGGKQYRVMQGETLRVELLEAEAGSEIKLDNVLMLGDADGIKLGDALKGRFSGWRVGIITADAELAKATGLRFEKPGAPVLHGGIRVTLWQTGPLP